VIAVKACPQCGTEYPASERFCAMDGMALRSAADETDLVGSIVAERYHILEKIGEGGMGQVYLAEHVKMGRRNALKVMRPGAVKDLSTISRFNREAAHASRISHANVAAIYDFGETRDGLVYIAMEYVEGPSLTSIIARDGALSPARAAGIIRQTADALGAAHEMGIVHRDLKPDNILVASTRDGGDLVKVVDFGIAKSAAADGQKVTKTGHVIGTPEYMSPEQLAGDPLDGRSDIYSLGLVAFHALTGAPPFSSESAQEAMIMRLTDRPKRLSAVRPDVLWMQDVQTVLDKALEPNANARYRTAPEFGRDLEMTIRRMPAMDTAPARTNPTGVRAPDVPPTRVVAKRGKRPIVLGIALVAIVVAAGLAMMSVPGRRPNAPTSPPSVADQLRELIDESKLSTRGNEVLNRVAMLEPRAKSSEELYLAASLRARVFETRGDTARACAELKAVVRSLATAEIDMVNDRMTNVLSCAR